MIGIIPAAGKAERMHGLPKMLLPIPGGFLLGRLFQQIRASTDNYVGMFIGTSRENDDVVHEYVDMGLVYCVENHATMSETILSMREHTRRYDESEQNVLFGMPDTYIEDDQVFVKLARALDDDADVAVGVFRAREGQHAEGGMCAIYADQVVQVFDKPKSTSLEWIWGALAWKPDFWQHIHAEDEHVGFGVQRAIEAGMDVRAAKMDGQFFDAGSPSRYFALIRHLTGGAA